MSEDSFLVPLESNGPTEEPIKAPLSRAEVEVRLEELSLAFTGKQKAFLEKFVELGTITKALSAVQLSRHSMKDFSELLRKDSAKEFVELYRTQREWERELTRDEVIANTRRIMEASLQSEDYKIALEANKFLGAQLGMAGTVQGGTAGNSKGDTNNSLVLIGGNNPKEISEDLGKYNDILAKLQASSKAKGV